jgi:perosamine synthetase
MIPMSSPDITDADRQAVLDVLYSPCLSMGPKLADFEREVARYAGTAYAAGVNSGTAGLHLCMVAAGVGKGDCVITSPFSFIASANCILYEQGTPVFVDVDPITGCIHPGLVAEMVHDLDQEGHRPKAILPVHVFGQPADMSPILEVARVYNVPVIEDACEAIGAEYNGHRAGAMGEAGVFAFYPNKQITTGEGGMVVTSNHGWHELFCELRNQGREIAEPHCSFTGLGYNYRMDEMSAALGLAQMGHIGRLLANRERVAGWYNERLTGMELVQTPEIVPATTRMSWFVYVVRILLPAKRDEIMLRLKEQGIPSRVYFWPIHLQPYYQNRFGYRRGDFPVAEHFGDVSLALPFSGVMTEEQVDIVCSALRGAIECTTR